jgi:hypothetical protein
MSTPSSKQDSAIDDLLFCYNKPSIRKAVNSPRKAAALPRGTAYQSDRF